MAGKRSKGGKKSEVESPTQSETKGAADVNHVEDRSEANTPKLRRSPRKPRPVTVTNSTSPVQQATKTPRRRAKKRSGDVASSTTHKWAVESPGKKRKLSHDRSARDWSGTRGESKQCEQCHLKDEEISCLKKEIQACIPKNDYEKMEGMYEEEKRAKDEALTRLNESSTRNDKMKLKYEKEMHSKDEALENLKKEIQSCIPKNDYEKMKGMYEEEKRAKDEALTRLKNEASSHKDEVKNIKLRFEEEKRAKDETVTRQKKEISSRVSKDEFNDMKLKYEKEKRSLDEEITRLKKEASLCVSEEKYDKMKLKCEEEKRSKDEILTRLKETSSHNSKDEFEKMKLQYEETIRTKDEALKRQKKEISSCVSKDKFNEMELKYEKEKSTLDEELARHKKEASLKISKEKFDKMKSTLKEEIRCKDETLESLRKEISTRISKEKFDKIKGKYENEKRSKEEEVARLQKEIYSRFTKDEYDNMKLKYEEEKRSKDDALTRLSAMASSRLRDNNPNIADLSDQNRPTKIAEKMSELYDNQWTDAFDALQNNMSETDVIEILLDILMRTYQHCKTMASESYFEKVQRCIEFPLQVVDSPSSASVLPDQLKQQIKEFRKSRAVFVIKDVENAVKDKLEIPNANLEAVQRYISCCVEISWLMVVQDPPLVLAAETSSKFDTNTFKDYTKRGPCVEYVVWPALLLHEGGALLSKGVAQGCSLKS